MENFATVLAFGNKMDSVISEARDNCSPADFKAIVTAFTIFKYSAKFWAPTSLGDDGPGYKS